MSSLSTETAFNLANGSIESVNPVTPLTPVLYSAGSIFDIVNLALSNSLFRDWIFWILNENSLIGIQSDIEPSALRNLLVMPFYQYNWGTDWESVSDAIPSMYGEGYYATERYRVVIADYSLLIFTILAVGELLWSLGVLLFCWFLGDGLMPNHSDFPEWDFASKCVGVDPLKEDLAMAGLMRGFANARTDDIKERIKDKLMFVGAIDDQAVPEAEGRVAMGSEGTLWPLMSNKIYT